MPCVACDRPNPRRCHLCRGRFYDASWTCHKCGLSLTLEERAQRWAAFWFHGVFADDDKLVIHHRRLAAVGLSGVESARVWLQDLPVTKDWMDTEFPELK